MMNEKEFKKMASNKDAYIKGMMSVVAPHLKHGTPQEKAIINKLLNDQSKIHFDADKDPDQITSDIQALHRKFNRDNAFTDHK